MATAVNDDTEYSWVPSHYRVCKRKMAIPREPKPLITAPEESLYFPLSLKMLVASAVRKHNLHVSTLPEELKDLVKSTSATSTPYIAKVRHCAQEELNGDINFGNFRMFPTALFEPQLTPGYLFRTNMLEQARSVMQFLISTQSADPVSKLMKVDRIVRRVLLHRYPHFLRLQMESFPKILVPPKDVQHVWFCHMLQSNVYESYIKSCFPVNGDKLYSIAHCCLLPQDAYQSGQKLCVELWLKNQPASSNRDIGEYELKDLPSLKDAPLMVPFLPRAEDVIADGNWITQFLSATSAVGARDGDVFLKRSLLGYQRFLFLLAKWPQKMEFNNFSPCPPIDLMWHTHLIQPAEYRRFSMLLLSNVHHHKLLPTAERTKMTYRKLDDPDVLWRSEFGETQAIHLSNIRSPPPKDAVNSYTCDACDRSIKDRRFHCQICQDFDLCAECEAKGATPGSHQKTHVRFLLPAY